MSSSDFERVAMLLMRTERGSTRDRTVVGVKGMMLSKIKKASVIFFN